MSTQRSGLISAVVLSLIASLLSTPVLANPGNGHGNGNGGNNGNSGNHSSQGNNGKNNESHGSYKNNGNPANVGADVSFSDARRLAVQYGLTGYKSLPPGIAKNLARGKPLPPGIAKKTVPASMLNQLPHYPGYEWRVVGDNLVLIALSTAIVTSIINGVFD